MNVTSSSFTDRGPRALNEDFLDCWVTTAGQSVACIADGLGGMGGGDIAAQLAVNTFKDYLLDRELTEESMRLAALAAHEAIRKAQESGPASRMASTLTAVALFRASLLGVHCGDSRALIARGKGIKRLTTDHSEGQRLFEAGKLSKEELIDYQRKHILESALGDQEPPRIDTFTFDLLPGDHVILTTDGVHSLVMMSEMQRLSAGSSNPMELTNRVQTAVANYGPSDNYSMVALFVG